MLVKGKCNECCKRNGLDFGINNSAWTRKQCVCLLEPKAEGEQSDSESETPTTELVTKDPPCYGENHPILCPLCCSDHGYRTFDESLLQYQKQCRCVDNKNPCDHMDGDSKGCERCCDTRLHKQMDSLFFSDFEKCRCVNSGVDQCEYMYITNKCEECCERHNFPGYDDELLEAEPLSSRKCKCLLEAKKEENMDPFPFYWDRYEADDCDKDDTGKVSCASHLKKLGNAIKRTLNFEKTKRAV